MTTITLMMDIHDDIDDIDDNNADDGDIIYWRWRSIMMIDDINVEINYDDYALIAIKFMMIFYDHA